MRQHYLDVVNTFEPFTLLLNSGATPSRIKTAVITLLDPYVKDKERLRELAVSVLANEAISIAQLTSRADWKDLLDIAFAIREGAISADRQKSFEVFCFFESPIREAQRKYSIQIVFEQPKDELEIGEFAFESFRLIGALAESTIQPFLKELFCLAAVSQGVAADPQVVLRTDFGKIVDQLNNWLPNSNFMAPAPWNVRLNQWRNIAQHHSYSVENGHIVARYGKTDPPNQITVTREEVFDISKELIRRLGALKSSRELTILNYIDDLGPLLPQDPQDIYGISTELAAAFATQGFSLSHLEVKDGLVIAKLFDGAPHAGPDRHIHCCQFIVPIANRFPGHGVEVHFQSPRQSSWVFVVTAKKIQQVVESDKPLLALAESMTWHKVI